MFIKTPYLIADGADKQRKTICVEEVTCWSISWISIFQSLSHSLPSTTYDPPWQSNGRRNVILATFSASDFCSAPCWIVVCLTVKLHRFYRVDMRDAIFGSCFGVIAQEFSHRKAPFYWYVSSVFSFFDKLGIPKGIWRKDYKEHAPYVCVAPFVQ